MKHLFRLILAEMIGPWLFGCALFTALIMAGEYLMQVSQNIVKGVPFLTVVELFVLFIPGVLVKTFAMSMLLSGLLAFGRLSGDSEIVALRAAGVSVYRMLIPVFWFAVFIAVVSFAADETIVPAAAKQTEYLARSIAKQIDPHDTQTASQPIIANGKVLGMVLARDFDATLGTLRHATIVVYNSAGTNAYYLFANELKFNPQDFKSGNGGWAIIGGATVVSGDGTFFQKIDDRAWPSQIPKPSFTVQDIITSALKNNDVLSMREIATEVHKMKMNPNADPAAIHNLEFGFWNKIGLPLAAVVFGLLGAPLGIRKGRGSTAAGFAVAVGLIFAYFTLTNFLSVYALGGAIPAWVASFTPIGIGLASAIVVMNVRNR